MAATHRPTIPLRVLASAKRLAQQVGEVPTAQAAPARMPPAPPTPPRAGRALLNPDKRNKLIAALRRLHPMD